MIYNRELDSLYEERERSVRNQRLDMDTYLSYIGKSEEEWREQLKPQADQRLRTFLVLRKLAQDEEIEVDSDEVQSEINTMIGESGESQEAMRQAFSSDSAKDSIRSSLLNRKVMQRLVEIIEGRGESTDSSDEAEAVEPDSSPDSSSVEAEVAAEPVDEPEPEAD